MRGNFHRKAYSYRSENMKRKDHKIEPATTDDIPQLADLLGELFALEPYFKPDRAKQLRALQLIIEKPETGFIMVLREGGQALAMVSLLFTVSTAEGGPAVLMEDFIVRAEHRGTGLGSQLLEHAIQFAGNRGFTRITLLTDGNNAGGIHFCQKHGFAVFDEAADAAASDGGKERVIHHQVPEPTLKAHLVQRMDSH